MSAGRDAEEQELDSAVAIVETIMTQHWDMAACPCWICQRGRAVGLRPRIIYGTGHMDAMKLDHVDVHPWGSRG